METPVCLGTSRLWSPVTLLLANRASSKTYADSEHLKQAERRCWGDSEMSVSRPLPLTMTSI